MTFLNVVFLLLCIIASVLAQCNMSAYAEFNLKKYTGPLATDPSFWRYQKNDYFVLTNGLATDIAVTKCTIHFTDLYTFAAGRSGPVSIQNAYKVMCSNTCLESDNLHQSAIEYSGCSCSDLSLLENDFCKQNSARLLCDITGYCGIWDCRIDDFMCPRYEFNRKQIFLKGYGNCLRPKGTEGAKQAGVYAAGVSTYSISYTIIAALVSISIIIISMLDL